MSRTSSKKRYIQILSWLDTFLKSTPKNNKQKPESRLSYYQKKGN
tara:strand:+ start:293 stop:427 length:135 start_codon:yes stop_codon:yes gene_type:complete